MYKTSNYNVIKTVDSKSFLVNTKTTAVLDISSPSLRELSEQLCIPNKTFENQLGVQVIGFLVENGFLVKADLDEIQWLHKVHWDARNGRNAFAVGIVLTMACNFRCTYCYETHHNVNISDDIVNNAMKYVEQNVQGKQRLRVAWFGGEPLIMLNHIEKMTNRFVEICKTEGAEYSARISTNGFLLTPDVSALLRKCFVNEIQVTLDGTPEVHDKRRYLANGKPTFDKILMNIKLATDFFERFIIRINIDNQNKDLIPSLLRDYLYDIRDKIMLSFSIAVSPGCVETLETWTTPPKEFWEIEKNLGILADNLGFKVLRGYPLPCTSFCMAYQNNSFLIDPFGQINRCPKFLGMKEQSYGELCQNGNVLVNQNSVQTTWSDWSPFNDSDCASCNVLPLCMGGCLLYLPTGKNKDVTHRCFAKYNIVDSILRDVDLAKLVGTN